MGSDAEEGTGNATDNNQSSEWKGVTLKYAGKELKIGETQVPYVLIVAASIILLVDSITSADMNKAYAISVAAISMATGIAAIILSHSMKVMWLSFGIYIGYFLLLWNLVGAIILTFYGPFINTTNSYFAIWVMFACSVVAAKVKYGAVTDQMRNSNALTSLMMASLVLIIAILFLRFYDWRNIFALIVAAVSTVVCAIFIYLDKTGDAAQGVKLPVLSIFAFLWILVVIFVTFPPGKFALTSNGFFAAWGGCIFSVYAACTC